MAEETPEIQPSPTSSSEIELGKIRNLTEGYKDRIGKFDIVEVGESGFILQNDKLRPMAGNDWILFDYDDTLAATTEIKQDRQALFRNLLEQKLGYSVSPETSAKIIILTDEFSRWRERAGEEEMYHAGAHMSALTFALEKVSGVESGNIGEAILGIESLLTRVKLQNDGVQEVRQDDPFYFKDRKLILRSKRPWSKDIENIFLQTGINPPTYEESVTAVKEVGSPKDSIHRINVGVFTYGEPYFQLLKTLQLLEKHPDLPISQIWLTRKPKGQFIEELIRTGAVKKTELDYVPPELEDYPGDSLAYGSGYPLGINKHTIILFDDNPEELRSVLESNQFLKEKSGATIIAVRSRRSGTKTGERLWEVLSPYGEIDFSSGTSSGAEIIKIFKINQFLALRKNLGEQHPRVKLAANGLARIGVDTGALKSLV